MKIDICFALLSAMGVALATVSGFFWKVILMWKKESEGRLVDAKAMMGVVKEAEAEDDETKIE